MAKNVLRVVQFSSTCYDYNPKFHLRLVCSELIEQRAAQAKPGHSRPGDARDVRFGIKTASMGS